MFPAVLTRSPLLGCGAPVIAVGPGARSGAEPSTPAECRSPPASPAGPSPRRQHPQRDRRQQARDRQLKDRRAKQQESEIMPGGLQRFRASATADYHRTDSPHQHPPWHQIHRMAVALRCAAASKLTPTPAATHSDDHAKAVGVGRLPFVAEHPANTQPASPIATQVRRGKVLADHHIREPAPSAAARQPS